MIFVGKFKPEDFAKFDSCRTVPDLLRASRQSGFTAFFSRPGSNAVGRVEGLGPG
jgi:hypothetical protein